ncbi:hypothetical protein [Sporosarcina ureae]|uniref:hypothetical protein n=1 Tax=Sporosarcina ureae TaxID=1571 RepID=UPI0009DC7CC3|nr:hypothetical protein [Sporosarcina ureae]ARF16241.1 hypothetical protein SporoP17a_02335 [Sporosarcina ureae]
MKSVYMLVFVLCSVFLFNTSLGENYDFSPSDVTFMNNTDHHQTEDLAAVNIEWDSDQLYTKKTYDILSVAKSRSESLVCESVFR